MPGINGTKLLQAQRAAEAVPFRQAAPDTQDRLFGSVLSNRYEIRAYIGPGSAGRVYRAFDSQQQRFVAVKVLAPAIVRHRSSLERIVTGARLARSVSHPNILQVHGVAFDGDRCYICMELVRGFPLRLQLDIQKRTGVLLPRLQIHTMAQNLLEAIAYTRSRGIQLNLAPENIWMTDDGSIQIQDLAPAFHPDARDASIQYEVAEILHELFCGWTENCAAMPIRHLRRNVPRHISKAIMKALREAPEDRHATSVEFLRRIRFGPWELRRQMLRSILHRVRLHRDDDPGQLRSDIA